MKSEGNTAVIDGTEHMLKHAGQEGPRTHEAWAEGDVVHQGDIIVVNIGTGGGVRGLKAETNQVVDGDTQGSRHCVEGGAVYDAKPELVAAAVKKARGIDVDPKFCGRVFEGPCVLTHPEHRHHQFPESLNAVVVQRNLDAEEREARVQD